MSKSIMQTEKECYISREIFGERCVVGLEEHHIFFGNPGRKLSEKYGLKVWLTYEHHRGDDGVHMHRRIDLWLKKRAQEKFEETHTREEFIQIFGRNYL